MHEIERWCGQELSHQSYIANGLAQGAGENQRHDAIEVFAEAPALGRVLRADRQLGRLFDRSPHSAPKNPPHMIRWIALAYAAGEFDVQLHRVPASSCREVFRRWGFQGHPTESPHHQFMKAVAAHALMAGGATEVVHEHEMHGGRADVYSPDQHVIVECGNTSIWKLRAAMADPTGPGFALLPYQAGVWAPFEDGEPRSLLAVEFLWDRPAPIAQTGEMLA